MKLRKRLRWATPFGIFCFVLALNAWSQVKMWDLRVRNPVVPQAMGQTAPVVLHILSMGQPQTLADVYYLQAVALYGQRSTKPDTYQNLAPLLERAIALDPDFCAAYLLAGTALTLPGMDHAVGMRLLRHGAARLPNHWMIQFLYGFAAYDLNHDTVTAARAFGRAAAQPGAPLFLPHLATRVSAQAHDPAIGIALMDTLLEHATDEDQRASYVARRKLLLLEHTLMHLQGKVDAYRAQFHHPPAHLTTLVEAGFIDALPEEPTGGRFELTEAGLVTTTHDKLRLGHPTEVL